MPETDIEPGLPWQAFAIAGDKEDPAAWKLPHHTRGIYRAIKGKVGIEHTVDWELMPAAVAAISQLEASPEDKLKAANHLAAHYRKADRGLPDTLAILV